MLASEDLAQIAERLVPGFLEWAEWGDVWTRPIEAGGAMEWTVLAALVSHAEASGLSLSVPLLAMEEGKALFPLRNEVPHHHGAQPGHAAALRHRLDLADRFRAAFVPKVVFSLDALHMSVFREGCPYHEVMTGKSYEERPDILFLLGRPAAGYPRVEERGGVQFIEFWFELPDSETVGGEVQVRNAPYIPCTLREPAEGCDVPVAEIIECSINKPKDLAKKQAKYYGEIFQSGGIGNPPIVFVTGNDLSEVGYPNAVVDLRGSEIDSVARQFLQAADLAFRHLPLETER